jgi:hypothetical protein
MFRLRYITPLALLLGTLAIAPAQENPGPTYFRSGQTANLVPGKVVTAKQKCENLALAAGLATLSQRQSLGFDQNYWAARLGGAEFCGQKLPSLDDIAHAVNQQVVLPGGQRVRVEANVVSGAPTKIDAIIAGIKNQQLALLLWHGHPYYLTGITYSEQFNAGGFRQFTITEMRLADTFGNSPAITFQRGRDNADEIGGLVTMSVTPI